MTAGIVGAVLAGAVLVAGGALAASTSLERALSHLQQARNELEADAGKDKGGFRKDAIDQVSVAIDTVRKGIEKEQKKDKKK
jgi:hypothetical protein